MRLTYSYLTLLDLIEPITDIPSLPPADNSEPVHSFTCMTSYSSLLLYHIMTLIMPFFEVFYLKKCTFVHFKKLNISLILLYHSTCKILEYQVMSVLRYSIRGKKVYRAKKALYVPIFSFLIDDIFHKKHYVWFKLKKKFK